MQGIIKGKGTLPLAFFLVIFFQALSPSESHAQGYDLRYPAILRLDMRDTGFRQFTSDVQANRRRLVGMRANLREAAENLTIYQYTVRQGEDLFFIAARCNVPYSAIVSLNRLGRTTDIREGALLFLPSCPGLFIPENIETDLEMIIAAERQNSEDIIELKISRQNRTQVFGFFPGADFTPTERGYFLYSGFRFPLRAYRITSSFGLRADPFSGRQQMHKGIDLAAPAGTEVFAAADGVVTAVGEDPIYGNYIIISHSNNWTSLYGHLQMIEIDLRSEVKSSTLIGRVGSTGQSTGPHLHFELRQDGKHFDPSGRLRN